MANYDKYEPKVGGFRAYLGADWDVADLKKVIGVGLDASGNAIKGAANTGLRGVLVLTEVIKAGEQVIDVMTSGDIVDFGGTPGTNYYADPTTGVVNSTKATGKYYVGHTVEGGRLVVRFDTTPVV